MKPKKERKKEKNKLKEAKTLCRTAGELKYYYHIDL